MTTATLPTAQETEQRDALVGRLFESAITTMEVFCIYIGDTLGLYRSLADLGAATSTQLAEATGTQERYVREWLEQQAAASILEVENPEAEASERRFRLPRAYHEVFLNSESLNYMSGLLKLAVGVTRPLPAVLRAFREGGGVPYADYTADTYEGIGAMNRPMFVNQLGTEWLPAVPDINDRLQSDPPARVADVGCGTGWSSIAIANAYPKVEVHGFDLDEPSIARARANAAAEGLSDRVTFAVRDAAYPGLAGRYDLVTAFETIHDMARPVEALRKMRALLAPGGALIVADERVAEQFAAPGDEIERMNYAFSVIHCLPSCMAETPSAATGTVIRPSTMRKYAHEAGFREVQILPIENDFWRFYRLVP
jgi:2-polyprenyl-3-methyl-5-hydroxy-6-metoxy-1,4-benzoquinol methylase